jgi:hypothetical protein
VRFLLAKKLYFWGSVRNGGTGGGLRCSDSILVLITSGDGFIIDEANISAEDGSRECSLLIRRERAGDQGVVSCL